MKWIGVAVVLGISSVTVARGDEPDGDGAVRKSIVNIFTTQRLPNVAQPWRRQEASEIGGTGAVIEGQRILTNAHVVSYASEVLIQPEGSSEKLPARVEFSNAGIDLAVLKVDAPGFFEQHPALPLAEKRPRVRDTVLVYGYPEGGNDLSITRGIVSRIEYAKYYYETLGLRIQVDAAINPGNSGGPAVVDGQMIGVVFSHLEKADNIGYIIPNDEVKLFLADIADGKYDGKPISFASTQTLENPALRRKLGLDDNTTGIVVTRPYGPEGSPLKAWDLITKVDSQAIDNAGKVDDGQGQRLGFFYKVQMAARDGQVPLTIVREGNPMELQMPVTRHRKRLLGFLDGGYPSFLVWGPLVFTAATAELSEALTTEESTMYLSNRNSPILGRRNEDQSFEGEQLVVLTTMFPHELVKGYDTPFYRVVSRVNGTPVKNLKHLVELIRGEKGDFIVIDFVDRNGESLVMDRKAVEAAREDILAENGIRASCSPDLKEAWEHK